MSNKIIPMNMAHRGARSPLDEFLPEDVIQRVTRPDHHPLLDEFGPESTAPAPVPAPKLVLQDETSLWPFFAAALVAVGATLLILATAAKYGYF